MADVTLIIEQELGIDVPPEEDWPGIFGPIFAKLSLQESPNKRAVQSLINDVVERLDPYAWQLASLPQESPEQEES